MRALPKIFRVKSYLKLYQRLKKSIPLSFFPKKCLLKSSAGYAESKPDNTSINCQKSTFFSKPTIFFFIKKPNYGRKHHYWSKILWTHVMEFWRKCQKFLPKIWIFLAESPKIFDSKCKNFHETNHYFEEKMPLKNCLLTSRMQLLETSRNFSQKVWENFAHGPKTIKRSFLKNWFSLKKLFWKHRLGF